MARIVCVITILDNLPLLKEQVPILREDPLISEIVVVSNGSQDGTNEWLAGQDGLTTIIKENNGAGPGRNAGINATWPFDYALFLDGGIRPLIGGTRRMLDYLEATPEADVIGLEIPHLETDYDLAWRRWPNEITPDGTYRNMRLSHTAYCLTRAKCWDGLRFSEEGPFAEPGWGVDDDEMAYQWLNAGIIVHVATNIHPYRRASGSFRRLFRETGIWPSQYGSVYEKRLVWCQQNWPQYHPGIQWGEPWLTLVIDGRTIELEGMIQAIKLAHDLLRRRAFDKPWDHIPNPYSIVVWHGSPEFKDWAQWRALRQHHGAVAIVNGEIVRRNRENEDLWTGDFRMHDGPWRDAVREHAKYSIACLPDGIESAVSAYNEVHPQTSEQAFPYERREI